MYPPECKICGSQQCEPLGVESFLFPTVSYLPDFHEYENFLCSGCGTVFAYPQIDEDKLSHFYNSNYWRSINDEGLSYGEDHFNSPIDLTNSITSLKRAKNFFLACERAALNYPQVLPQADDLVIDLGAYQGLFLHALRQKFQVKVIPCDYSQSGMDFASTLLGMDDARVTKDVFIETFDEPARFVTMVHFLEHINDPIRLLRHVRKSLLSREGILYIEVPNLYGHPLSDPFHFFTYSKESLCRTLSLTGFEVLEIFTNSFPPKPKNLWGNQEQNLICLARPTDNVAEFSSVNADLIRKNVQIAFSQHSTRGVWSFGKYHLNKFFKAIYYFIFAVLLERVSPKLMMRIARATGVRKWPSNQKF